MERDLRHYVVMHQFTHKLFLLFAVLIPAIIIFVAYIFFTPAPIVKNIDSCSSSVVTDESIFPETGLLSFGSTTISIAIARTSAEHERGLSHRKRIGPAFSGMLFIFDRADKYGFWMPDMCFPIDIIWIDTDWRVVHIADSVTPESYPNVFTPDSPALYVLEVEAGMSKVWGFQVGTVITRLSPLYK